MFEMIFKIGITLLLTALTMPAAAQQKTVPEFTCVSRDSSERFPMSVRFQTTSLDQIEAAATYRVRGDIPSTSLKRVEFANQPKTAVFPVDGAIGISGEAKVLITKDALKYGEVGTVMVINQTTRESAVYQCQRTVATFPVRSPISSSTSLASASTVPSSIAASANLGVVGTNKDIATK